MRRIVSVLFHEWDRFEYHYICDLDDVVAGDRVVVDTRRGEAVVTVVSIKQKSEMATASILRKAQQEKTP